MKKIDWPKGMCPSDKICRLCQFYPTDLFIDKIICPRCDHIVDFVSYPINFLDETKIPPNTPTGSP